MNEETSHRLGQNISKATSDKGMSSKIHKRPLKRNKDGEKRAEDLNRQTPCQRKHTDGKSVHEKKRSTSYAISEPRIKTTVNYHLL